MNLEHCLSALEGSWLGTNRLRMMPGDPYVDSAAEVHVTGVAGGHAMAMTYTWADGGRPQDGHLLITNGQAPGTAAAIWLDSWHQSPQWMELGGPIDDAGVVRLDGSYGQANAWRITVEVAAEDRLKVTMDNVVPEMDLDYRVVEMTCRRRS